MKLSSHCFTGLSKHSQRPTNKMESRFGRNKNHLFYVSIMMKFCIIFSQEECKITGKEKRNCILTLWMPSSCSCIRSARPTIYSALFKKKKGGGGVF